MINRKQNLSAGGEAPTVTLDLDALGLAEAESMDLNPVVSPRKTRDECLSANYAGTVDLHQITTPEGVIAFTELCSKGGVPVTKELDAQGQTVKKAATPRLWSMRQVHVQSIQALGDHLQQMAPDPSKAIVLGEPTEAVTGGSNNVRKASPASPGRGGYADTWYEPTLRGSGTRLLVLDIDADGCSLGVEVTSGTAPAVVKALEGAIATHYPDLEDVDLFYSFTASQKPDGSNIRLRVFAVLDRLYTWKELRRWAAATSLPPDLSVFSSQQLIYVAAPIRPPGQPDPIANRMGLIEGLLDTATLKIPDEPQAGEPKSDEPRSAALGGGGAYLPGMIPIEKEFCRRVDLASLLLMKGYAPGPEADTYCHPGSQSGQAGLTVYNDRAVPTCYSFNQTDPLRSAHRLDAFNVYERLWHDGDHQAARRAVGKAMTTPEGLSALVHNARISDVAAFESFERDAVPDQAANDPGLEIEEGANPYQAKPVPLGFDFTRITARPWILGRELMRGQLHVLTSPGGTGKSALALTIAVAVATNRPLTGVTVLESGAVWVINNEDDQDELYRRLGGILKFHDISVESLQGRLFVNSGYGAPFIFAKKNQEGAIGPGQTVELIVEEIREKDIKLLIVDPLVSTHECEENSNEAMNRVADQFKYIAKKTGCGVQLVHHNRKVNAGGDSEASAGDAESGRGASALKDASRSMRTLARMNENTAKKWGIPADERPRYIRDDSAKSNYALPDGAARWYRLETVELGNGDSVGVPVPFDPSKLVERAEMKKVAEQEEKLAQARKDVLTYMGEASSLSRGELVERLKPLWDLEQRAAEDRIKACIPEGRDHAVLVAGDFGGPYRLWIEKKGAHKTAPQYIRQERVADEPC
ncbi:helicase RepA family protein [Motiliproteus sp. SC1-56]|uniref:helicase RepA family protein n=1 Tax=Motiliproteus sp. SC1-56 TaxID=2799565 RepID=UPI001A8CB859|nr:helicase RepA family protein [Motiliproteus sp. SC1-56]